MKSAYELNTSLAKVYRALMEDDELIRLRNERNRIFSLCNPTAIVRGVNNVTVTVTIDEKSTELLAKIEELIGLRTSQIKRFYLQQ